MPKGFILLLFIASSFASFGCERPFVEVSTPQVTILSPPDLSIAIASSQFTLRLRSTSFRAVTQVLVNGTELTAAQVDEWSVDLALQRGLNTFVIEAIDADFVSSLDTIYVLRSDFSLNGFGPRLPIGLGGFAVTQLNRGDILLSGGANESGSAGQTRLYTLANAETDWLALVPTLTHGRVGHTASLLPDGRVLVAGGGSRDNVTDLSHLVEQVEIVDAFAPSVKDVVVVGDPIRRSYHTASVRITDIGTVLDLYGGVGDIAYFSNPRLGTRSDVRSFLLRNDSLFALTNGIGGRLGPAVAGHSQTKLRATSSFAPSQFLYVGAFFAPSFTDPVSFKADFSSPLGILTSDAPLPRMPRSNHADLRLNDGLVAIFGGRLGNETNALSSIEVYSEQAQRFFEIPVVNSPPARRFKHKAVRLINGTILVLGGFTENGLSTTTAETVSFGF